MAVTPKCHFNSSDQASIKFLPVTGLGTTAASVRALGLALGLGSINSVQILVDDGAAANCMVGDSAAQAMPLKAGADLILPLLGDQVYIKAASGTINVYLIFLGT